MSIALIVTHGYGNGTLTGTIADVVTHGYTIGTAVSLLDSNLVSSLVKDLVSDPVISVPPEIDEHRVPFGIGE